MKHRILIVDDEPDILEFVKYNLAREGYEVFTAQNGAAAAAPVRDTSVVLSGLRLDNPVIPASGTFGYGNEYKDFYDINILGSFSFKGTTREPRFGNPTPRIAECTAGMINAVGLQNPGIDAVIAEELPRLKRFFRKPVIANIRASRSRSTPIAASASTARSR